MIEYRNLTAFVVVFLIWSCLNWQEGKSHFSRIHDVEVKDRFYEEEGVNRSSQLASTPWEHHDSLCSVFTNKYCDIAFVNSQLSPETSSSPVWHLSVWDINEMKEVHTITSSRMRFYWGTELTSTGKHVLCYPGGSEFFVWSLVDSAIVVVNTMEEGEQFEHHATSHNGEMMAVTAAGTAHPLRLGCYCLAQQRWLWWVNDLDTFGPIAFSEDDSEVIATGRNGYCRLSSVSGKVVLTGGASISRGEAVIFSPNGEVFAKWQCLRPEGIFTWLFSFLLEWNYHMDVWDVKANKMVASFGVPKWGFDLAEFTRDNHHIVGTRNDRIYQLSLANGSETTTDISKGSDSLPGWRSIELSDVTADGQKVVRLNEREVSDLHFLEYLDLSSFGSTGWKTVIKSSGGCRGLAFSADGREITVVCTTRVFRLDAGSGKIVDEKTAGWWQSE